MILSYEKLWNESKLIFFFVALNTFNFIVLYLKKIVTLQKAEKSDFLTSCNLKLLVVFLVIVV